MGTSEKLKKAALVCFCACFFGTCLFFSAGMLIPGASSAAEGAEMPALIADGRISDGFGDAFETWFSKRFAFRGAVVDAFASLKETLFLTGNDQVIVGNDGFLFFADTLAAYEGSDPMTEEEIAATADALGALSQYAEETMQAEFLFVCAPDKNTIYSEYMPKRYQKAEESDLDRLYAALSARDVPFLDLRPVLRSAKEEGLCYHKRDTHWNGRGAFLAFSAVMETLDRPMPDFGDRELVETHDFPGDLDGLLYPGKTRYDDNVSYDLTGLYGFTSAYSTPMDLQITTRSAGKAGNLLLFRDSFANAWIGYFAAAFQNCRLERPIPYRIDVPGTARPDVVLVEIAERNLRELITAADRILPEP